jgi:hypothetical protein
LALIDKTKFLTLYVKLYAKLDFDGKVEQCDLMSFDQISMGKKYVLNEARGKIN